MRLKNDRHPLGYAHPCAQQGSRAKTRMRDLNRRMTMYLLQEATIFQAQQCSLPTANSCALTRTLSSTSSPETVGIGVSLISNSGLLASGDGLVTTHWRFMISQRATDKLEFLPAWCLYAVGSTWMSTDGALRGSLTGRGSTVEIILVTCSCSTSMRGL